MRITPNRYISVLHSDTGQPPQGMRLIRDMLYISTPYNPPSQPPRTGGRPIDTLYRRPMTVALLPARRSNPSQCHYLSTRERTSFPRIFVRSRCDNSGHRHSLPTRPPGWEIYPAVIDRRNRQDSLTFGGGGCGLLLTDIFCLRRDTTEQDPSIFVAGVYDLRIYPRHPSCARPHDAASHQHRSRVFSCQHANERIS